MILKITSHMHMSIFFLFTSAHHYKRKKVNLFSAYMRAPDRDSRGLKNHHHHHHLVDVFISCSKVISGTFNNVEHSLTKKILFLFFIFLCSVMVIKKEGSESKQGKRSFFYLENVRTRVAQMQASLVWGEFTLYSRQKRMAMHGVRSK
jgi:hypothetical protein